MIEDKPEKKTETKPADKSPKCLICKIKEGRELWDRGLKVGFFCEECFSNMVSECRSRSW